ncbi:hypothetical protein GEMRC1_010407 [Eukaryota sp. GEM-RC1]
MPIRRQSVHSLPLSNLHDPLPLHFFRSHPVPFNSDYLLSTKASRNSLSTSLYSIIVPPTTLLPFIWSGSSPTSSPRPLFNFNHPLTSLIDRSYGSQVKDHQDFCAAPSFKSSFFVLLFGNFLLIVPTVFATSYLLDIKVDLASFSSDLIDLISTTTDFTFHFYFIPLVLIPMFSLIVCFPVIVRTNDHQYGSLQAIRFLILIIGSILLFSIELTDSIFIYSITTTATILLSAHFSHVRRVKKEHDALLTLLTEELSLESSILTKLLNIRKFSEEGFMNSLLYIACESNKTTWDGSMVSLLSGVRFIREAYRNKYDDENAKRSNSIDSQLSLAEEGRVIKSDCFNDDETIPGEVRSPSRVEKLAHERTRSGSVHISVESPSSNDTPPYRRAVADIPPLRGNEEEVGEPIVFYDQSDLRK